MWIATRQRDDMGRIHAIERIFGHCGDWSTSDAVPMVMVILVAGLSSASPRQPLWNSDTS
jgi:hypothetical protein